MFHKSTNISIPLICTNLIHSQTEVIEHSRTAQEQMQPYTFGDQGVRNNRPIVRQYQLDTCSRAV